MKFVTDNIRIKDSRLYLLLLLRKRSLLYIFLLNNITTLCGQYTIELQYKPFT